MKRWVGLVALTRLVAFVLTENVYGDSVVRTWLGRAWAAQPHLIGSFDQGGFQFGPLHLYLVGLATLLPMPLADSGRLVSLVTGVATVWPLLALTKRMFGERAVGPTVLAFAFWGLHIQFSTTASGEAVNLLLVFACVNWLHEWFITRRRVLLLTAALMLNLACAARYDSWLFVPMLSALIWAFARDFRSAVLFGAASMAFAAPWLVGNWVDLGKPFYPFTYIDDFHRAWYPSEEAMWAPWYRLITFFFWPGAAVVTLTPLVAIVSIIGLVRAWREVPSSRFIIVCIVVPTVLYTLRSTFLSSFVPLARFTAKEVAFLLPFFGASVASISAQLHPRAHRVLKTMTVVSIVAWPVWLSWFTFRTDGPKQNTLRAISPVTTNATSTMAVANWLSPHAHECGLVVVDSDPRGYEDLQLSFYSRFASEKVARVRSPLFEQRLREGPVKYVVLIEGGPLERSSQLESGVYRGMQFREVSGFAAPFRVFERE